MLDWLYEEFDHVENDAVNTRWVDDNIPVTWAVFSMSNQHK